MEIDAIRHFGEFTTLKSFHHVGAAQIFSGIARIDFQAAVECRQCALVLLSPSMKSASPADER